MKTEHESQYQETLIVIKPDAVERELIGEIIKRFEASGFKLCELRTIWMTKEQAQSLYQPHCEREFFDDLVGFMISGECVVMKLSRHDAVEHARKVIGADGQPMGSIRGDYATSIRRNIVHASDSHQAALRELPIFFPQGNSE